MLRYALQNKTKLTRQLKKKKKRRDKQSLTQIKYHVRKAQTVLSLPQQDMVYSNTVPSPLSSFDILFSLYLFSVSGSYQSLSFLLRQKQKIQRR